LLAEKPGGPAGVAITCNGIYRWDLTDLTNNKRIVVAMYWEYHGYISFLSSNMICIICGLSSIQWVYNIPVIVD